MQRLSPLDASFLHMERDVQQLNVGSTLIFEGPAPSYAEVCDEFESLLHLVPRYRQRVLHVPGELGRPVWVDDQHFHIREHVRHHHLRGRGSDRSLCTLAVALISQPLDLNRPPWRTWLVTGLQGGRWALVNTNHHAMIDGISGADIMGVLLQPSPTAPHRPGPPWTPEPEPSARRLVADALLDSVRSPVRAARGLLSALRPKAIPQTVAEAVGVASLGEHLVVPQFGLDGPLGARRRWEWVRADLDTVKRIKNVHGGTVNDVVLAATAGGFRRVLESRGQAVDGRTVRTMIPVSTRHTDEQGTLGNRVSAVVADLPVGIADPVERLRAVSRQLHSLKASGTVLGVDALMGAAELVPGTLFALAVRTWARSHQRALSTVVTNVPGPQVPLYLLGRRLMEMYPYIPLAVDIRIIVGIASYAGQLTWGVTGDRDSVPDLHVLRDGIADSLAELEATTSRATSPETSAAYATVATGTPRPATVPHIPPATSPTDRLPEVHHA
jgi:diacylglycerol O-acyltransferase